MYRTRVLPLMDSMCGGDAEKLHDLAIGALALAGHQPFRSVIKFALQVPTTPFEQWGITFPSRVGLAAGFDKNAKAVLGLETLGWGFVEVGAVLTLPQPGNDRPRLFRLNDHDCVINRYGFNSEGVFAVKKRLEHVRSKRRIPVGANIGLNKAASPGSAPFHYALVYEMLHSCVDFAVVNVTSPNTPGLRALQDPAALRAVLSAVIEVRDRLHKSTGRYVAVLLKGDPDLPLEAFHETVGIAEEVGIDGLVLGNTTKARPEWLSPEHRKLVGGLSGTRALFGGAITRVRYVRDCGYKKTVIFAGGARPDNVRVAFEAGADLVQALTQFVFDGPLFPRRMNIAARSR